MHITENNNSIPNTCPLLGVYDLQPRGIPMKRGGNAESDCLQEQEKLTKLTR